MKKMSKLMAALLALALCLSLLPIAAFADVAAEDAALASEYDEIKEAANDAKGQADQAKKDAQDRKSVV